VKTILFVCNTLEQARLKFHEAMNAFDAKNTANRCIYSQLRIEFDTIRYEFVSLSNGLEDKLLGREFDKIIIEERYVTEEQLAFLKSRERPDCQLTLF
jgi:hypothetical protein